MLSGGAKALIGAALAGAVVLFAAAPAGAQDRSDLFGFAGSPWQVGGFVFVTPKFEGAKSYDVLGFPFIAPAGFGQGGSAIDIRGADDIRFRLIQNNGFEAGPLAGWRFGRDQDDAARLQGLGDIDGGLVVGAYAGYRAGPWFFSASYHHQVTGDDDTGGWCALPSITPGGSVPAPPWSRALVRPTPRATICRPTSASPPPSRRPRWRDCRNLTPSAGFEDVSIGATATIALDPRWTSI